MRRIAIGTWVALLAACASSEDPKASPAPTPVAEGGVNDAGTNEASVSDAGATPDGAARDLFPDTCAPGAFCPVSISLGAQQSMLSISARSESDIWVTGSLGAVVHFDGTAWSSVRMPLRETFGAVLARSGDETWLGSSMRAVYTNRAPDAGPSSWTTIASSLTPYALRDLWSAPGSARVWAALEEQSQPTTLFRLEVRDDVLTATPINGIAFNVAMNALDGISKDELWAVGDLGGAYRITAAESETPLVERFDTHTNNSLNGVSVLSGDDIWAVGTVGTVRRYRGPTIGWERVDVPVTNHLNAIAAVAPDDVWVVGDGATILHYDGSTWSTVAIAGLQGVRPRLRAVTVLPGRIVVAGERSILELRTAKGS
ncbi:hypothetical protein AKJ09_07156 [Labilithrix luteola]|uniref:Photosynthesis system II assembly factor Ycf48/Hcf136-like domain-containing protein n=1 Tax=Labilithrix luteola TaxID=1391654 RepID=A0A0K1Q415_9BACT|nr:hypothetical protein [Labilithrix luteola]AKV00493.1 hypothetical protein AKJ09_07156 [Labilithrix luteola]